MIIYTHTHTRARARARIPEFIFDCAINRILNRIHLSLF